MKYVLICLFLTYAIRAAEKPDFTNLNKSPNLAEHWADFIAHQNEPTRNGDRRHSRLSNDPEQQLEHAHSIYTDLVMQLHTIEQEANQENPPKKLHDLELACRVIMQALLHNYSEGNKEALGQADKCTKIAAYLKLMQDPFWHVAVREMETKKQIAAPPAYSIDELEEHLQTDETQKDRLIKELLTRLEQQEQAQPVPSAATDELAIALAPYKKSPEEIFALMKKIIPDTQETRTRLTLSPKSITLYNNATIAAIHAEIQFLQMHDQHDYLHLEKAFGAVVLTYLTAHDNGHPSGLKDAEKIMNGGIMEAIIKWKQKHGISEALGFYSELWKQINNRKHGHHNVISTATASSSQASSSQASSSSSSSS